MNAANKERLAAVLRGDKVLPPLKDEGRPLPPKTLAARRAKTAKTAEDYKLSKTFPNSAPDPTAPLLLPANPKSIRMDRPQKLVLIAREYVSHGCEMAPFLKEAYPMLGEVERARLAVRITTDPRFKQAVEDALLEPGLDERSRGKLVRLLWQWAESDDPIKAPTAVRILAKSMIAEKTDDDKDKPQPLPLSGLEAGMKRMGLMGPPVKDEEAVQ